MKSSGFVVIKVRTFLMYTGVVVVADEIKRFRCDQNLLIGRQDEFGLYIPS